MPEFTHPDMNLVVEAAVILAFLGAIDSLLTSLVADNMTGTRHSPNKELIGQGIGNTVAGLFHAIPGAGATMRTVVNIRSGGATRISGMAHSVVLLAAALPLAGLASQIPHAVLAGILVKVGYDIVDWSYLTRAHRGPRWDLILMALVLGLTVFVDLITAVAVGVVLAALAFVKQIADIQLASTDRDSEPRVQDPEEREILKQADGKIMLFDFAGGPLSFGAAADLGHQVRDRVSQGAEVLVLDFSLVPSIDLSAARAVETIMCDARKERRTVFVSSVNQQVQSTLNGLDADHCLPKDGRFEQRIDALRAAQAIVNGEREHLFAEEGCDAPKDKAEKDEEVRTTA